MKITWENGQAHYEPDEQELGSNPQEETSKAKTLQELRKVSLTGTGIPAAALKPAPFIWGPAVVRGTVNLFGGGPGAGKSTLLFYLLCARARPRTSGLLSFLGFPLEAAPTGSFLVLIEEAPEGSTARKLIRAQTHLNLPITIFDRILVLARKNVTVGANPLWQKVEKLTQEGHVSDIFLDTLAAVSPLDPKGGDSNSEAAQVKLFSILTKAVEKAPLPVLQPTIWIAAHNRKGGGSNLDDVSGSIQRTGQCDTVALLEAKKAKSGKVESSLLTFQKLREDPDEYPEPIRFTADRNGIKIVPPKDKAKDIQEPKFVPAATRILEVLATKSPSLNSKSGAWSWSLLHKALPDISGDTLTRLLQSHESAGNVVREKVTNFYMLAPKNLATGLPS